jgi:hypothetical protein
VHGKDEDQDQPEKEVRNRDSDESYRCRRVVGDKAAPHGRQDTCGDSQHEPDQHAEGGELECDRKPLGDHRRDLEPGSRRLAEIALQRETQPLHVLDRDGLVESVFVAGLLERDRVAFLAGQREHGIAGQRPDPGEDEDAREEEDDQRSSYPAQDEAGQRPLPSRTTSLDATPRW